MSKLNTKIAGLKLRNPLMPAVGPITRDAYALEDVANKGAGALVTKTISTEPAEVPRPNMAKIGNGLLTADLWSEIPLEQWIDKEYPKAKEKDLPLIASIGYTPEDIEEIIPKLNEKDIDAIELSTQPPRNQETPNIPETIKTAKQNTDLPTFIKLPYQNQITQTAQKAEKAGIKEEEDTEKIVQDHRNNK